MSVFDFVGVDRENCLFIIILVFNGNPLKLYIVHLQLYIVNPSKPMILSSILNNH